MLFLLAGRLPSLHFTLSDSTWLHTLCQAAEGMRMLLGLEAAAPAAAICQGSSALCASLAPAAAHTLPLAHACLPVLSLADPPPKPACITPLVRLANQLAREAQYFLRCGRAPRWGNAAHIFGPRAFLTFAAQYLWGGSFPGSANPAAAVAIRQRLQVEARAGPVLAQAVEARLAERAGTLEDMPRLQVVWLLSCSVGRR